MTECAPAEVPTPPPIPRLPSAAEPLRQRGTGASGPLSSADGGPEVTVPGPRDDGTRGASSPAAADPGDGATRDAPSPTAASTGLSEAARLFADAVAAGLIPMDRPSPDGAIARRSSTSPPPPAGRSRTASTLATVLWACGATAVAVLGAVVVLVVLRMPDRATHSGPLASLDVTLARTLLADRLLSVATWVGYVATLLVVGGTLFRAFVSRPAVPGRGGSERLLLASAAVGIVAGLVSLALRAMVIADGELGAVGDLAVARVVVTSRFGDAACLRLLGLALFGLVMARPPRGREHRFRVIRPSGTLLVFGSIAPGLVERVAYVIAGLVALASFTCVGHPQATEPRELLVLAQVVHVGAASVWFGGGVLLAVEIRAHRRHGSARCSALTVARFSVLAGAAVVVVGLTGAVLAVSQLSSPAGLVSTAYGRALTAKLALVGLVVALGAYNHLRLVPAVVGAGEERAWRRLGATAAAEGMIIAAGVLVATAAMTSGGL